MTVVQLREYRITLGELDRFVQEWSNQLAPLRRSIGFTIPGAWTIPDEGRFVWLMAHPGDWDAFEAADQRYFASPERMGFTPDPARLIEEQSIVRLTEVSPP